MLSYKPLWITLIEKNVRKTELVNKKILSWTLIDKMKKGGAISLSTVEKLCKYLDCRIEDVVEYIHDSDRDYL